MMYLSSPIISWYSVIIPHVALLVWHSSFFDLSWVSSEQILSSNQSSPMPSSLYSRFLSLMIVIHHKFVWVKETETWCSMVHWVFSNILVTAQVVVSLCWMKMGKSSSQEQMLGRGQMSRPISLLLVRPFLPKDEVAGQGWIPVPMRLSSEIRVRSLLLTRSVWE